MARRAPSRRFAPLWGVLLAVAALVTLFAPRPAAAATATAGLCDDRGLSAIAPLPVVPVTDASLEAAAQADGGPQLCEVDATAGCRVERGRGAPEAAAAVAVAESALESHSARVPAAPSARASWPAPAAAFVPPVSRRRVEHPPRA